jgi:hypothetical protein
MPPETQTGRDASPAWPPAAGPAGGGEDLRADRQARRVRRLQLGRPERPGHRLWRAVDAHPQVHRRVHARALAGLRLRRELEGGADQGKIDGKTITWGDTHHPAISETNGEYDGQFLFINDKANPRLAVIDLRDFETKQIVVNPIFKSEHGGAFVTPNTEYVIEAAQYPRRWRTRSSSRSRSSTRSTAAASPTGSSTARKAASSRRSPSPSNCRPTGRTCRTPARAPPTAGRSPTRSAPSATSAASRRAARPMRPAARPRTPTTCT